MPGFCFPFPRPPSTRPVDPKYGRTDGDRWLGERTCRLSRYIITYAHLNVNPSRWPFVAAAAVVVDVLLSPPAPLLPAAVPTVAADDLVKAPKCVDHVLHPTTTTTTTTVMMMDDGYQRNSSPVVRNQPPQPPPSSPTGRKYYTARYVY